ncbi:hypothetical protein GX586_11075 [bacterium]|nr:hypothetical protein [bacterium]
MRTYSNTVRSLTALLGAACAILSGCATRQITTPAPMAVTGRGHQEKILAIMPLGSANPYNEEAIAKEHRASWFPRVMYGKGEVSFLSNTYEEVGLAIYNRFRGYNAFRRVVFPVDSRSEADSMRADLLLCYHVNTCYARGLGANWNFVEWVSYEGAVDIDVAVYDLTRNQRIYYKRILSTATTTSPWSTYDVRAYIRRQHLRGVTLNNAIAQIDF